MKLLLDTSVWLRATIEPQSLPDHIRGVLSRRESIFGLCAISLWEVAKKVQIGKLTLRTDLLAWLEGATPSHIQILPITAQIVADATRLPEFPNRDPADELIVATARIHKLTLLTTDTKLKAYRHARVQYFTPAI